MDDQPTNNAHRYSYRDIVIAKDGRRTIIIME